MLQWSSVQDAKQLVQVVTPVLMAAAVLLWAALVLAFFFSLLICSVNYQYASNKSLFWYLQAEPSLVQKKKEDTHFKKHL